MIPFDEYESFLKTLDILESEPDILKKLKKAESEIKAGKAPALGRRSVQPQRSGGDGHAAADGAVSKLPDRGQRFSAAPQRPTLAAGDGHLVHPDPLPEFGLGETQLPPRDVMKPFFLRFRASCLLLKYSS